MLSTTWKISNWIKKQSMFWVMISLCCYPLKATSTQKRAHRGKHTEIEQKKIFFFLLWFRCRSRQTDIHTMGFFSWFFFFGLYFALEFVYWVRMISMIFYSVEGRNTLGNGMENFDSENRYVLVWCLIKIFFFVKMDSVW